MIVDWLFTDVVFELEELVYDTTEGGIPMVMVCVNLISGILVSRSITVDVAPKAFDPLVDTATSEELGRRELNCTLIGHVNVHTGISTYHTLAILCTRDVPWSCLVSLLIRAEFLLWILIIHTLPNLQFIL